MAWPDPLIHVVDDDPVFTKFMENHVRSNGYGRIRTFNSGEAFLDAMNEDPAVVLLDFSLDGLNGMDILKQIKKSMPGTKVVVITVLNDPKLEEECLKLGAAEFLIKEESRMDAVKTRVLDILQETRKSKIRKTVIGGMTFLLILALLYFVFTADN